MTLLRHGEPGAAPRNGSTEYAEVTREKRFPGLRTRETDNSLHHRRQDIRFRAQHVAGWRLAPYPAYKGYPQFGALFAPFVGPRKRSAAGQGQRARSRFCAGWRLRLTRPTKPGADRTAPRGRPHVQRRRAVIAPAAAPAPAGGRSPRAAHPLSVAGPVTPAGPPRPRG